MSIKIYEAWRWKRTLGMSPILYEVETIMKKQMYARAQELLKDAGKGDAGKVSARAFMSLCARLTQFQVLNPYRGPQGDFTCDFCMWDWKQHYYMHPLGSLNNWKYGDIYTIPGVEDFRYWNNTDEPEGMSMREWRRRGRIWDEQYDGTSPITKIIYHVLDPYAPSMDLTSLFDPRWATEAEAERYGLPMNMRKDQEEARKKVEAKKSKPRRVRCKLCKNLVPKETAHQHQEAWIGHDCCWDERLKSSE